MDWQPIEIAPRDGTWLLLLCPAGVANRSYEVEDAPNVTIGRYGSNDCQSAAWHSVESHTEMWDFGGMTGAGTDTNQTLVDPSHWMPLPEAPHTLAKEALS